MRLVYEHILFPGVFIQDPAYLIHIKYESQELGIYGFDVCSERELGIGILCRACELIRCSMVNPALHDCRGVVKLREEDADNVVFVYDQENYTFKKQKHE